MITADRITRGRPALIAWITITVLLLGLFATIRVAASRDLDEQIDAAQDRAVTHAAAISSVVEPRPGTSDLAFSRRELATLVQAEVFDDPTVARVRLYGVNGVLLFATDQEIGPGDSPAPSEDPGVISAASGTSYRSIVDTEFTWSTVGATGTTTELLQVFEPLRTVDRFSSIGVVQIDSFMDDLRSEALSERDLTLTVIAILALVSLGLAVLTYRRTSSSVGDGGDADATPEDPRAEASALRTKLKTAEGRRAKAERSLEEAKQELTAAQEAAKQELTAAQEAAKQELTAAQEAATAAGSRATTLESELAAAAAVAAATPEPGPTPEMRQEMEELRRQLAEAESRATEATAAAAAAVKAEADTVRAEAESARKDAESARKDAETARQEADTARQEADAVRAEAESARQEAEAARKEAESARKEAEAATLAAAPAPVVAQAVDPSTELLERLEERIVAAERRAREAEERIDRIAPLSEEASDLRTRLAKTAARKRLGPSADGEG